MPFTNEVGYGFRSALGPDRCGYFSGAFFCFSHWPKDWENGQRKRKGVAPLGFEPGDIYALWVGIATIGIMLAVVAAVLVEPVGMKLKYYWRTVYRMLKIVVDSMGNREL